MPHSLTNVRDVLSRVKPWLGVAIVLAVLLLGYYTVQGVRFWRASGDVNSVNSEIEKSEQALLRLKRQVKQASEKLESPEVANLRPLAELNGLFAERSSEELMAEVAAIAFQAKVNLTSMNPASSRTEVIGDLEYQVETLSIAVGGATTDIYNFLTQLHANFPVVAVSNVNLSGFGDSPLAQMNVLFYLSPEPKTDKEPAG